MCLWFETAPSGEKVAYGLVLYVTGEHEKERALEATLAELSSRQERQRQLFSIVSHELRTPTTVIKGFLESLLEQRKLAPPAWVPALEQMSSHADRMQSLIEELLLLSRLEQDHIISDPQPVLVSELLSDVIKQARALSGRREHLFSLEADARLQVAGNHHELFSAFSNLVFKVGSKIHFLSAKSGWSFTVLGLSQILHDMPLTLILA
jgi:two-component system phosphate regulon sensor histidine kinase PhoR